MLDVIFLDRLEQAEALLKPLRVEILRRLHEPRSCTAVAGEIGQTPQKVYYHVKRLEAAGLVEQVAERRVRGITEGVYQAAGRSYWLSPAVVGALGPRPTDASSLGGLLELVEQVQAEVAAVAAAPGAEQPSVGIAGEVRLRPEQRTAFLRDLRASL